MRADKFFAEKFSSRTKASEALKKGLVLLNGRPLSPSDDVDESCSFTFLSEENAFVSNGGYKLSRAIEFFHESVEGLTIADLGSSTGGFCDCLLKCSAKKVFCVDVGRCQLAPSLANDLRVSVMDGVNARSLCASDFPEMLDAVTADLSFISLKKILPALERILGDGKKAFLLFKPQFECEGKNKLKKGGICPISLHQTLLSGFYDEALSFGFSPLDIVNAPIRQNKNVEYMMLLVRGGEPLSKNEFLNKASKLIP